MKLNARQKTVLVIVALLLCMTITLAPKKAVILKDRIYLDGDWTRQEILWDVTIQRSLVVLVIGVTLIMLCNDNE